MAEARAVFASPPIWAVIMCQLPAPANRVVVARVCRAAAAALAYPEVWADLATHVKESILNRVCMKPSCDVREVRRVVELYSISSYDENSVVALSKNGHLPALQWLHARFGMNKDLCTVSLYFACTHRHLKVMQWLSDLFAVEPVRLSSLLDLACERGQLEIATWLIDVKGATIDEQDTAFFGACCRGNVALVRKLVDRFGICVQSNIRDAMSHACDGGNLDVIRWLDETYQVDPRMICADEHSPFEFACVRGGNVELVLWLVARYGVTPAEARKDDDLILRRVCALGLVRMAECLVDTFGLTAEDIRDCAILVEEVCEGEEDWHLEMAQWLFSRFQLNARDLRGVKLRNLRSSEMRAWITKVRSGS
jgi:hypothetical protein